MRSKHSFLPAVTNFLTRGITQKFIRHYERARDGRESKEKDAKDSKDKDGKEIKQDDVKIDDCEFVARVNLNFSDFLTDPEWNAMFAKQEKERVQSAARMATKGAQKTPSTRCLHLNR